MQSSLTRLAHLVALDSTVWADTERVVALAAEPRSLARARFRDCGSLLRV